MKPEEINSISGGGEKFCDCRADNKESFITIECKTKVQCKNWCCNLHHSELVNQLGKFYIWDAESKESVNIKWEEGC